MAALRPKAATLLLSTQTGSFAGTSRHFPCRGIAFGILLRCDYDCPTEAHESFEGQASCTVAWKPSCTLPIPRREGGRWNVSYISRP